MSAAVKVGVDEAVSAYPLSAVALWNVLTGAAVWMSINGPARP